MPTHLIACVLGGTAAGAKTELHDVAFAAGESLEAVHEQLLDGWFGDPRGLHVDAWCLLDHVEGHRITLAAAPPGNGLRLYFINIGGYRAGVFGESHAWGFFAAADKAAAKARAKRTLLQGCDSIHKDDLYDVDDCLQVAEAGGWHVHLTPDAGAGPPSVVNGYAPLPKSTIDSWIARHGNS